jgi:hypothetical protein
MIVGTGCGPEGVHPDPNRFPPPEKIDYTIDISKKNEAPLSHFFHPDSLKATSTIGNNSDLNDEYNKVPQQIDRDPQNNFYLVQEHSNTIRVYDDNGQFKYTLGQNGRGPGEFSEIFSFAFSDDYQKLYVLDRFEIEIFILNSKRYEYENTIQHNLMRVYDMCLIDNDLFVSGYKIAQEDQKAYENESISKTQAQIAPPIHKFNLETFDYIRSFGFIYPSYSGWGYIDGRLSETLLGCNESTDTVVGYLKHYSYIFGYDRTGQQKWVSKLEGYKSTRSKEITTSERPAFYPYTNENIFNWKYPTQKINNNKYSLLQFSYSPLIDYLESPDAKKPYFNTILVNTKTGELFHSEAYKYIGAWKDKTIVTMDINPENLQKTFTIHEIQ